MNTTVMAVLYPIECIPMVIVSIGVTQNFSMNQVLVSSSSLYCRLG